MRIFYVCSYGGCASTMLCNFLSKYYKVYHIHSRYPPPKLCGIKKTKITKEFEWFNYLRILKKKYKDKITVIYLYREPSTSLLSKHGWGRPHFSNIGLNPNKVKKFYDKSIETRLKYSKEKKDLFGIVNFFKNYVMKNYNRNYKIFCLKYEAIWENLSEIFKKLKIPEKYIENFPKKYEKKLSEKQEEAKKNFKKKYKNLELFMKKLPPIFVIRPRK